MCHMNPPLYANLNLANRNNGTFFDKNNNWPPDQGLEQSTGFSSVWNQSQSKDFREANQCFGTRGSVSKLKKDMEEYDISRQRRVVFQQRPSFLKDATELQRDNLGGIQEAGLQFKQNIVENVAHMNRPPEPKAEPASANRLTQNDCSSFDDLAKDSDMSDFEEDSEHNDESNPLESGWEYALFVRKSAISEDVSEVHLFSRDKLFYCVNVETNYVENFGKTIYIRYKQRCDGSYMMLPSSHHYSALIGLKVRPKKSVEMKLTGVVGFSNFPERSVPVWNDIIGWQTIYFQRHGLLRKGLAKVDEERLRQPLVIIEFTVLLRADIPSERLQYYSDSIKITDMAPLKFLNGQSRGEIAGDYYSKDPKRMDDLKFACRNQDGDIVFSSKSHPNVKVRASLEQCAVLKSEKHMTYYAIVVPDKENWYRGLVIAPKMVPKRSQRSIQSIMGISDNDVQKQLRHMMAFIEQEANEKAEEIDAKAEEEFNIEKGRLVQQQRQKIMEFYEKKEKQVELQRKIQASNSLNAGRLMCLKAREDHIRHVLDEAKANLSRISADSARYPAILKGLIMQALLQLLEKEVVLRCREKDFSLVEQLLPECLNAQFQQWGDKSHVSIDKSNFLPSNSAGGVEVLAKAGKIRVSSTLESRLELIAGQIIPQIRTALFGPNPNRKFFD